MFKNKILLITGGTGSFGNAVLNQFLKSDIKEIRSISKSIKLVTVIEDRPRFRSPFKIPFRCSKAKLMVEYTIKSETM